MLVTDLALARRLERAEGSANSAFVESRATLAPGSGAMWRDFDGTYAMFDCANSPLTQTFGLGLFTRATETELVAIERWFAERGAAVHHEVCPLADAQLLELLPARGYRPVEQSTVLVQELGAGAGSATGGRDAAPPVRAIEDGEVNRWADCAAAGWGETPELAAFMRDFGRVSARSRGTTCFVAEHEGQMIAAAALAMHDGVALLAGASTIPAWRGRGAQGALLRARLAHAAAAGCDLAMVAAAPGSTSQTNTERQGFRIAYTRTKWGKAPGR